MDPYIGRTLDNRYEILERVGTGGMAVVYKAKDNRLGRLVAVKILRSDLAQDDDLRRRFNAESQAVAQLSSPHIVAVYDVSRGGGDTEYIVMELIDGITLKQYMEKRGRLNWRESLHFITQIMRGLAHAHSRGIIHRDIKPQNIMVLRDGSVKVADFGIAVLENASQTLTQQALGSVHYISPEQARGERTDARSDIYSAGVVLYEMLTGRLPFEGESAVSVALQHLSATPPVPRSLDPDIPEQLELICMKAMAPELPRRYPSAEAMIRDLEAFRKDPAISLDFSLTDLRPELADEPTRPIRRQENWFDSENLSPESGYRAGAYSSAARQYGDWARQPARQTPAERTERRGAMESRAERHGTPEGREDRPDRGTRYPEESRADRRHPESRETYRPSGDREPPENREASRSPRNRETRRPEERPRSQNREAPGRDEYVPAPLESDRRSPRGEDSQGGGTQTVLLAVGGILALVLAFLLFSSILNGIRGGAAESYVVRSVLGYTVDQARELDDVKGIFEIRPEGQKPSDDYPVGTICDQDPEAGRTRKGGNLVIKVWISAGEETALMPNVVHQKPTQAEKGALKNLIAQYNLTVTADEADMQYSDEFPAGYIISSDPAEGGILRQGDTIRLVVSKGPHQWEMASFVGMNYFEEVRGELLDSMDLVPGDIRFDYSSEPFGTILSHSPAEGETVREGMTVDFTVSRGSEPGAENNPLSGQEQSNQEQGQSGQEQGQSGQEQGQSNQEQGQSGQGQGQSGQEQGQSGQGQTGREQTAQTETPNHSGAAGSETGQETGRNTDSGSTGNADSSSGSSTGNSSSSGSGTGNSSSSGNSSTSTGGTETGSSTNSGTDSSERISSLTITLPKDKASIHLEVFQDGDVIFEDYLPSNLGNYTVSLNKRGTSLVRVFMDGTEIYNKTVDTGS